jgi:dihydroorotase-like cyclic amidohydrolase
VLVDPNVEFQIDERKLHSRVKSSPYNQWHLQGKPVQTILRGKTIAKNGEIVTEPFGKFIAM